MYSLNQLGYFLGEVKRDCHDQLSCMYLSSTFFFFFTAGPTTMCCFSMFKIGEKQKGVTPH